ncbi:MAG: neutral/alkaline non-lysosomal ceramidase N-terminal domain-containing protein [Planctomycetota bacterium]|nr:neutral/alkaline non-lysosomal ceramidase N-terminal domain-containing protein [Planctomycetota bacterium]
MNLVRTPQSRCRAAVAWCDITPPIGIYHRMWGAALHDQATGVHRPLEATLLWLEPGAPATGEPQVIVTLDHCILDREELQNIRQAVQTATSIDYDNILITVSHTHGAGWMSRTRSDLPGGELLGPYLDQLAVKVAKLAREAQARVAPANIVYGTGRCNLAAHRDYLDAERGRFVCGFNPEGAADDTLLVARISDESGTTLASVVNYACHPTTLAWENTLISPDWVGAMREVVEHSEGGRVFFLQGASGDLGPREGFVGDTSVADRNGWQVGHAALSTLASLSPPGTEYRYAGPVVSGTSIGTWRHESLSDDVRASHSAWHWEQLVVDLPYRHDLPTIKQTTVEREHWLAEEAAARAANDEALVRDCRAQVEQRTRQLNRLNHLPPGHSYPLTLRLGLLGDAIWVFVPGELYQIFQTTLRLRFAPRTVIVTTLTNDWQPGYIPPASTYGYDIYQEVIAATSAGSLELLIESISRRLTILLNQITAASRHER